MSYNFNKNDKIIIDFILYDNNGNGFMIKSLIDTGSESTFISDNVYKKFNFKKIGSGTMTTGNNTSSTLDITTIRLTLPKHSKYINNKIGVMPNKKGFDILIGMDIIAYCNISINTTNKGFDFNIELPLCK